MRQLPLRGVRCGRSRCPKKETDGRASVPRARELVAVKPLATASKTLGIDQQLGRSDTGSLGFRGL